MRRRMQRSKSQSQAWKIRPALGWLHAPACENSQPRNGSRKPGWLYAPVCGKTRPETTTNYSKAHSWETQHCPTKRQKQKEFGKSGWNNQRCFFAAKLPSGTCTALETIVSKCFRCHVINYKQPSVAFFKICCWPPTEIILEGKFGELELVVSTTCL